MRAPWDLLLHPLCRRCYRHWLESSLPALVGAVEEQDAHLHAHANEADLTRLGGLGPLVDVDLGLPRLGRRR
jgi:hypothetical protein